MGMYNIVHATMTCARCGRLSPVRIEAKFGFVDLLEYRVGDRVEWEGFEETTRPPDGDLDVEGFAECPLCDKDFFCFVHIRSDHIQSVSVAPSRPGYTP